jgi:hypothetical protein
MARRAALVTALATVAIAAFVWGFSARACQTQFSIVEGLRHLGLFFFICAIAAVRFPFALIAAGIAFGAAGFVRRPFGRETLSRTAVITGAAAILLFLAGALLAGPGAEGACDLHFGF